MFIYKRTNYHGMVMVQGKEKAQFRIPALAAVVETLSPQGPKGLSGKITEKLP